jgi:hypothetical protein
MRGEECSRRKTVTDEAAVFAKAVIVTNLC